MKKVVFVIAFAFVALCNLFAGTKYENKVYQINLKYYSIFKYGYEIPLSSNERTSIQYLGSFVVATEGMNYVVANPIDGPKVFEQYEKELEAARSLMTPEEIRREWERSDIGQISSFIKQQHDSMFVKDEFETKKEFYNRTTTEAKQHFDKTCASIYWGMDRSLKITIIPQKYDAETQQYVITVEEKFNAIGKSFKNQFSRALKCTPQVARALKRDSLFVKDEKDVHWSIIDGKDICVSSFSFDVDGIHVTINRSESNLNPLCINYKDIDANNEQLINYKWCYTQATDIYKDIPNLKETISKWQESYKCYNPSAKELEEAFLNSELPYEKDCETLWQENKILFQSKDELFGFVQDGSFEKEIDKRKKAERIRLQRELERQKTIKCEITVLEQCASSIYNLYDFKECLTLAGRSDADKDRAAKSIKFVNDEELNLNEREYNEFFDLWLRVDKKMQKEYEKNGACFPSKKAFIESYAGDNYKEDLKKYKSKK